MEQVEPVQMNIYQSNTCRKNLRWLHFDNESRVQERHQVREQQSCIFIFVVYLTIPSRILVSPDFINPVMNIGLVRLSPSRMAQSWPWGSQGK